MTERSRDIKLLLNYDGGPEYDQEVCGVSDGRHVCYREPGHYGVHCCGCDHYGEHSWPCRVVWPNAKYPDYLKLPAEEVDFEREI